MTRRNKQSRNRPSLKNVALEFFCKFGNVAFVILFTYHFCDSLVYILLFSFHNFIIMADVTDFLYDVEDTVLVELTKASPGFVFAVDLRPEMFQILDGMTAAPILITLKASHKSVIVTGDRLYYIRRT